MVRESTDNHLQADKTIDFPTSSVFDRLNDSTRNTCHLFYHPSALRGTQTH